MLSVLHNILIHITVSHKYIFRRVLWIELPFGDPYAYETYNLIYVINKGNQRSLHFLL